LIDHARLQLGAFERAEQAYDHALELDANDGLLHNNLAVIYLSTGRPRRATESPPLRRPVPCRRALRVRQVLEIASPSVRR